MDYNTLQALHGSVRKWIKIVEWRGADEGMNNCPLCRMFVRGDTNDCRACPVYGATGKTYCDGSPYTDAWMDDGEKESHELGDELWFHRSHKRVIGPRTQRAAERETLFLISLLPKKERKQYFQKEKRK